jgi:hypothetical protein
MKKYSANLAFVDLMFNLCIGFVSLFIISFLLINPIAKNGVVDPPIVLMIEMTWEDTSDRDIDLYLRGPDGAIIYYGSRDNGYATLKRDDLGGRSDTYVVNGIEHEVERNYEIITLTALPDGDYVINAHFFGLGRVRDHASTEPISIRMTGLQPFMIYFEADLSTKYREEVTAAAFKVVNGEVKDLRTDIQVKLRTTR